MNKENSVQNSETAEKSEPLKWSFYRPTMDKIEELVMKKRAGLDSEEHKLVLVWDIGEVTALSNAHLKQFATKFEEINMAPIIELIMRIMLLSKIRDLEGEARMDEDSDDTSEFEMPDPFPMPDSEVQMADSDTSLEVEMPDSDSDPDSSSDVPMQDPDASSESREFSHSDFDTAEKFYEKMTDFIRDDGPFIEYDILKHCGLADRVANLYVAAMKHQRLYNQRWLHSGKCLQLLNYFSTSRRKCENVVLAEDGTPHAIAQLLISGLSKQIPLENIHSTWDESQESVFEKIQERFGNSCLLVYVTSKNEKNAAIPEKLQIPIWEIKSAQSLEYLYDYLHFVRSL